MPQARKSKTAPTPQHDLPQAKRELVAALDDGQPGALLALLARYPHHAAALVDLSVAYTATSAYADVAPTAETERVALRARELAFDAVFGAPALATAVAPALAGQFASLKALRQARKLTMPAVAARLGLGVDVLSALEAGRIRAQSLPERFARAMSDLLDTTADQLQALLGGQGALAPALRRGRSDATPAGAQDADQLDFAEAVRLSPEMTADAKAAWLAE